MEGKLQNLFAALLFAAGFFVLAASFFQAVLVSPPTPTQEAAFNREVERRFGLEGKVPTVQELNRASALSEGGREVAWK